jgi:hypothetical protein
MDNIPRQASSTMNTKGQILLVISNLVLAASVSFHVFKATLAPVPAQGPSRVIAPNPPPVAAPVAPVELDVRPLQKPLETLDQSVNRLNLTLQRFNTTTIQYEYLQNEIERLTGIDQTLVTRINEAQKRPSTLKTAEFEKSLKPLKALQDQVQVEMKRRRETLGQLIVGLERQLDAQTPAKKVVTGNPERANPPNLVKPASSASPLDLKPIK